jgi:hypothetical protein
MTTPTLYNINNGIKGVNAFGAPFSAIVYNTTLAANTEATVTIPGGSALGNINASTNPQYLAVFSYSSGATVFVANNDTAAVPAGDSLAAATSIINPSARLVKAGDVLSIISAGTPSVSIELFYLQEG